MKLNYQLSKLAEKDLEDIWEYTFLNWTSKQADKYIKQLIKEIKKICLNPEIGRPIFNIKPKHRIIKINSHLIVYKIENENVKVDRIVHERMDIKNQI